MRRLMRWMTAASLLALTGCAASMDSGAFVDRAVDFRSYRTYNWAPPSAQSVGDPRLQKNPAFVDQLQGEIEKQLAAKGFNGPASRPRPDLLVRYRAAVTGRVDVNGTDSGYGYCSIDCSTRLTEYETATLVINIVDARTRKVVWRGWARDSLDDVLNDSDRMGRKIHEAVTEMMAKFPSNTLAD